MIGFDPWHATAPFACREYKRRVVGIAIGLQPTTVLEIGCGVGDIISRIEAESRYGFDIAPKAITAANLLHGSKIFFGVSSISEPENIARILEFRPIDLLILVNWCHGLDARSLKELIDNLNCILKIDKILIDAIKPGMLEQAHSHSRADLSTIGDIVLCLDAGDTVRDLYVLKVR
jgi:SAM-dependent methyltransferase